MPPGTGVLIPCLSPDTAAQNTCSTGGGGKGRGPRGHLFFITACGRQVGDPSFPRRRKERTRLSQPLAGAPGAGRDSEFRLQVAGTEIAFSTHRGRHLPELSFLICTLGDTESSAFAPHTSDTKCTVSFSATTPITQAPTRPSCFRSPSCGLLAHLFIWHSRTFCWRLHCLKWPPSSMLQGRLAGSDMPYGEKCTF